MTITRREGEALVLTRAGAVEHQKLGLQLAAQLIATSLADAGTPNVDRLRVPFPWLEFVNAADRDSFATEIVGVARACAAVAQCRPQCLTRAARKPEAAAVAVAAGNVSVCRCRLRSPVKPSCLLLIHGRSGRA